MKKLWNVLTRRNLFLLGLSVVLLAQVPLLILGPDSVVTYHDQLDGEIITYIYQAKYLFSGQNRIPEFLNGALKTTLTPPAPLAVLLFCVLPPFSAYEAMQLLGQMIAYAGMFLLAELLTEHKYIALITGLLYAFLPFLPVYGLSQYGIPMLLVSFYYLGKKRHQGAAFAYVAFYTLMSSLVLCGFLWLGALGMAGLYLLVTGKLKKYWEIAAAFGGMLGLYVLTNLSLLGQLLGIGEGYVSHKEEYTLNGGSFLELFLSYVKENGDHSTDYHEWILWFCLGILLIGAFRFRGERLYRLLAADLALLIALCMAAALWNCDLLLGVREKLGALGAFQFMRILWTAPALWYAALALCLGILWQKRGRLRWIGYGLSVILLAFLGMQSVKGSTIRMCIQELLIPEYETISWSDYMAMGVMEQVEEYIRTEEGLEKEQYRVASLGIDPSAALYHGFYSVDGYSNNYDLEYKHAFREVIAPELERNDWLRTYYDDWGNRCYLYSAEIPGYFNVEKGSAWYNDLQINTQALKDLGCDYLLSAAYIVNAEQIHLRLLREEAFDTESSYYRIYIYKLDL